MDGVKNKHIGKLMTVRPLSFFIQFFFLMLGTVSTVKATEVLASFKEETLEPQRRNVLQPLRIENVKLPEGTTPSLSANPSLRSELKKENMLPSAEEEKPVDGKKESSTADEESLPKLVPITPASKAEDPSPKEEAPLPPFVQIISVSKADMYNHLWSKLSALLSNHSEYDHPSAEIRLFNYVSDYQNFLQGHKIQALQALLVDFKALLSTRTLYAQDIWPRVICAFAMNKRMDVPFFAANKRMPYVRKFPPSFYRFIYSEMEQTKAYGPNALLLTITKHHDILVSREAIGERERLANSTLERGQSGFYLGGLGKRLVPHHKTDEWVYEVFEERELFPLLSGYKTQRMQLTQGKILLHNKFFPAETLTVLRKYSGDPLADLMMTKYFRWVAKRAMNPKKYFIFSSIDTSTVEDPKATALTYLRASASTGLRPALQLLGKHHPDVLQPMLVGKDPAFLKSLERE